MNYTKVSLLTQDETPLCLSDEVEDVFEFYDIIEDSKNGSEIVDSLKNIKTYLSNIRLDRETSSYVRIRANDVFQNQRILIIRK